MKSENTPWGRVFTLFLAGVAAALAAREDVAVQDLEYRALRRRLTAQGQVLELPSTTARVEVHHVGGTLLDDVAAATEPGVAEAPRPALAR